MKVLVLGGGVVGVAAAYYLGRDGHEVLELAYLHVDEPIGIAYGRP